ncbi:MAG: transposase domain-containing protein [bacterium]
MELPGETPLTYDALLEQHQLLRSQFQAVASEKAQLEAQVAYLTQKLARLKKLICGAKSERFVPEPNGAQGHLEFMASEPEGDTTGMKKIGEEVTEELDYEPFEYLRDVIARIATHPHKKLHELLPQKWKRAVPTDSPC